MDTFAAYDTLKNFAVFFASVMLIKYVIYLIIAPLYPVKEKIKKIKFRNKVYEPLVSVVIPAWNEEVGILKTVKSALLNTYENIEIIVVNDGSQDKTDQVMKNFKEEYERHRFENSKNIIYISQDNGGKGKALNTGIENSNGEIILTVDADSVLDRHAISNLIEYYKDPKISGVVGNVIVDKQFNFLSILQSTEYLFGFYFKRTHAVVGAEYIFGGACASFRKNVFEEIGLFDTQNKTEDIEMSVRMRINGYKCNFAENVICRTESPATLKGLINQRLRWKKGRFDTFIKYRRLFFSRNKNHNKWLTFFVLPYALLSELQLLLEPIAISLLVGYSIISSDYLSLSLGILFISLVYFVNSFFSFKKFNFSTILSFPVTWSWFYILVYVEFVALLQSLKMVLAGDEVVWQNWQRKGVAA